MSAIARLSDFQVAFGFGNGLGPTDFVAPVVDLIRILDRTESERTIHADDLTLKDLR